MAPNRALLLVFVLLAVEIHYGCGGGKPISETLDDATITTRVKTALLNDPAIAATRISVDTYQGVVTLSGTVRSPEDEQKAVSLARRIQGVRDVKSSLQVGSSPSARLKSLYR